MSESSTCPAAEVERWLPIPDWEGLYEVSDLGRVRSVDRTIVRRDGKRCRIKGRPISQLACANTSWYSWAQLCRDGKVERHAVHVLVLTAFIGPRPPLNEARHGPNGRMDNSLANLCWGTKKENFADRVRDGDDNRGEKHGNAKLTQAIVDEIRERYAAGERQVSIARSLNVGRSNVWAIVHNKNWSYS